MSEDSLKLDEQESKIMLEYLKLRGKPIKYQYLNNAKYEGNRIYIEIKEKMGKE